ncbi:tigger transposable element-derived protein 6-like [Hippoglossus stenolepis]|uniref:tigger transposable element-derived protein 6-like n=1 Tax=Hippoglossus stenolepis TaxID=195615 RepID=UPI001FAF13CF|nr:tigger transposable element-derived protein 6-like [Hippoglossus stenolepis]
MAGGPVGTVETRIRRFKLGQEWKKILLLVDNCTAHDVKNTTLRNIRLEFLPKNTTSILQPCEQGIIRTAKAYFRKEMAHSVLCHTDEGSRVTAVDIADKISLLDAVLMLRDAWADVEASTIRNCWRKGGLVISPVEELTAIDSTAEINTAEFEQWIATDDSLLEAFMDEDIVTEERERFGVDTDSVGSEEREEEEDKTPVLSLAEMRNAICILRTGLLHLGFNNFDLLHCFTKEVDLVLDKSTIQESIKFVK